MGEGFDQRIINYFAKRYNKGKHVDITKDTKTMDKFKRELEKARRTLSSQVSTRLDIESFFKGEDYSESLIRAKSEEFTMDLSKRTLEPVEQVLKDAKVKRNESGDIVLVGALLAFPSSRQCLRNSSVARKSATI